MIGGLRQSGVVMVKIDVIEVPTGGRELGVESVIAIATTASWKEYACIVGILIGVFMMVLGIRKCIRERRLTTTKKGS